tara:strand:- start:20862 stop:21293 length:432 start_codon:yes stop_codon:yes gene_type:complete
MASGPQIGELNLVAFNAWVHGKTDDDFREYVRGEKLNRVEIAAETGIGKSALGQNPRVKGALKELEDGLRERNVLPPLKSTSEPIKPPQRDLEAPQRRRDAQRLNALEQQNAALRAELSAAKGKLEQYSLLDEMLAETGRMPR